LCGAAAGQRCAEGRLLPELSTIRDVSTHIAAAVVRVAMAEGIARAFGAARRRELGAPGHVPSRTYRNASGM
jgi:malic enzyme